MPTLWEKEISSCETIFFTCEKKKKQKSAREKNKWAWKNGKKCAWKRFSACEKKDKNAKKGFHGDFLFSREKKYIQEFSK